MGEITYSDLYKELLAYVKAIDPNMPMQIRGTPPISQDNIDEWIVFDILSMLDGVARRNVVERYVEVQIICYSRYATLRADNKFDAIYSLTDKYNAAFHRKDLCIKNTCIQFKESRIVPLDLRSTSDFAKDILQNLPPLHTMSMVILNQGIISSYT